ncbi:EF-hand domain-containing family member C2 isoform X1 [Hydra vulgaris]|uniref:EF-hand domain-containing family member C2 isoform X1 n=1 Tax=Hydra vulgaris TaxID=6087 RepID=UPI001F5E9CDD|nr:EF-hand domain-containing family member C2 [Hydra vulgaris]
MVLPLLPGISFDHKLGKDCFHKSHCFDYKNDVAFHLAESKLGIGRDIMPGVKQKKKLIYLKSSESSLPAWVAFDKQVLCFNGYFQEIVHEKQDEKYRFRKCKIYFYLEDNTIQVIELKTENSGIPQGTLIRRHRIPLPPPNSDEFYTVDHFNIGIEIKLYSRLFHITGCDSFTEKFLRKLGVRVNPKEITPEDPYEKHRQQIRDSMQPLRPYEKEDTLFKFLENDSKVLRFYCYWDDSESLFGDQRDFVLHYFLADDTVEIREIIPPNSGRDAVPLFLRRQKLPKVAAGTFQPGQINNRTVLNVFGPMGRGGRYILDSLKTGAVHTDYYHDSDVRIGEVLNVWGRSFIVCDCDEFTKDYYKFKYGIDNFTPLNYKFKKIDQKHRDVVNYKDSKIGFEEDSSFNSLALTPKPPKKDFKKFMERDRYGLDSKVLRFVAMQNTKQVIEVDRRFIISYFLSDDTFLIFEPPQRNSGLIGGKFLERGRVRKPNSETYYSAQDLYVGNHIELCKRTFIIIGADEYALKYMEEHSEEFPQANISLIVPKFKKLVHNHASDIQRMFQMADKTNKQLVPFDTFKSIIKQICGDQITDHEILTLCRAFSEKKHEEENFDELVALLQEQLRKVNYESFSLMQDACSFQDTNNTGLISSFDLHNICKSFKLPLKDDLLQCLLQKVVSPDGKTDYCKFIELLNWKNLPAHMQNSPASLGYSFPAKNRRRQLETLINVPYNLIMKTMNS